ncbi:MAG: twin-arginine translocase TatA/TatE family subunit [Candidatus Bathyarchaeia archaeon]
MPVFPGVGTTELLIIVIIILLLFGAKRIPEIARSFGEAVNIFKKEAASLEGAKEDYEEAIKEAAKRLGIDTEGKSISELAEAIAKRKKQTEEVS